MTHSARPIMAAVITGEHNFNVPAFHALWHSLPAIDCYVQDLDNFVRDDGKIRSQYDVLIFYNYHLDTPPGNEGGWWQGGTKEMLEALGETDQGLFVLHHALGAFPQWPFWSELVGIPHQERASTLEEIMRSASMETLHIEIADAAHPITHDLAAWDLGGEIWGDTLGDPGADSHVLLRTRHPKSKMMAMAWTRRFKHAPVFCLQPGHDDATWADPQYRTVVARAITWLAQKPVSVP